MGSILAVTNPRQYQAGVEMSSILKEDPTLLREPAEISRVLDSWCTPFSGVAIICNRRTSRHKDVYRRNNWYDVIATMGDHSTIRFHLPGLCITLAYSPRTVIALSGRVLSHAVDSIDHGDRACFAWFMRDDVRKYLNVDGGNPSSIVDINYER